MRRKKKKLSEKRNTLNLLILLHDPREEDPRDIMIKNKF